MIPSGIPPGPRVAMRYCGLQRTGFDIVQSFALRMAGTRHEQLTLSDFVGNLPAQSLVQQFKSVDFVILRFCPWSR